MSVAKTKTFGQTSDSPEEAIVWEYFTIEKYLTWS